MRHTPGTLSNDLYLSRRQLVAGIGAGALLAALPARAQTAAADDIVLTGGRILTLDPAGGDLEAGDVLVRNGAIAAIEPSVKGGQRIDMAGKLVMPGFIDTHWHMWNSIARGRSMSRLGPLGKTMPVLGRNWTKEAGALSVRLACAEAVHSGITTVNNWAHNTINADYAAAELDAMQQTGLRGRFSYGYPQTLQPGERMDIDAFRAFHAAQSNAGGMIDIGLCTRGPDRSAEAIWQEEWKSARELGASITTHIASNREAGAMGNIARMQAGGYLGTDVQLVHATHASKEDFAIIARSGSPVSLSPWTELQVGYGFAPVAWMADAGCRIGLSVDNLVLAGNADMFSVMKLTADLAAGGAEKQAAVPDMQVLRWATLEGAATMVLDKVTGSLAVGKRADIIAIDLHALNMQPEGPIDFMLTHAATPTNVDFVMIDGKIHKRDGKLAMVDEETLRDEANVEIERILAAAGLTD